MAVVVLLLQTLLEVATACAVQLLFPVHLPPPLRHPQRSFMCLLDEGAMQPPTPQLLLLLQLLQRLLPSAEGPCMATQHRRHHQCQRPR